MKSPCPNQSVFSWVPRPLKPRHTESLISGSGAKVSGLASGGTLRTVGGDVCSSLEPCEKHVLKTLVGEIFFKQRQSDFTQQGDHVRRRVLEPT